MIEIKATIPLKDIQREFQRRRAIEANIRRIVLPTDMAIAGPMIRYEDIQTRRYNILDRSRSRAAEAIATQEDSNFLTAMSETTEASLNFLSLARQIFQVHRINDGEDAIFDRDSGGRVRLDALPMATRAVLRYPEIVERRFEAFERARQRIGMAMREAEDQRAIALLIAATSLGSNNRPLAPDISTAFSEMHLKRLVPSAIVAHPLNIPRLLNVQGFDGIDRVEDSARVGVIQGADLYASTQAPQDRIFLLPPSRYAGIIAVRQPLRASVNDQPHNRSYEFVLWQELGMAILEPSRIVPIYVEAR